MIEILDSDRWTIENGILKPKTGLEHCIGPGKVTSTLHNNAVAALFQANPKWKRCRWNSAFRKFMLASDRGDNDLESWVKENHGIIPDLWFETSGPSASCAHDYCHAFHFVEVEHMNVLSATKFDKYERIAWVVDGASDIAMKLHIYNVHNIHTPLAVYNEIMIINRNNKTLMSEWEVAERRFNGPHN